MSAAVAVALVLAFWAGFTVNRIGAAPTEEVEETVWAEATQESIGRSIALSVEAVQPRQSPSVNRLQGTLTARSDTNEFSVGDFLYSVDDVDVRVVEGRIPFYRDLHEGLVGEDVRQLNVALAALQYSAGSADEFTSQTTEGVRQWQKDRGQDVTATVLLGELLAVPELPTRLYLDDSDGSVGAVLTGGERLVYGVASEPQFRTILTQQQVALIPEGTPVTVTYVDSAWQGRLGAVAPNDQGVIYAEVTADNGGLLCGDGCGILPAQTSVMMTGTAEIVPQQTGILVPVAAITMNVDGSATVFVGQAGVEVPITILGSQDGLALVDGVSDGDRVRIGEPASEVD